MAAQTEAAAAGGRHRCPPACTDNALRYLPVCKGRAKLSVPKVQTAIACTRDEATVCILLGCRGCAPRCRPWATGPRHLEGALAVAGEAAAAGGALADEHARVGLKRGVAAAEVHALALEVACAGAACCAEVRCRGRLQSSVCNGAACMRTPCAGAARHAACQCPAHESHA